MMSHTAAHTPALTGRLSPPLILTKSHAIVLLDENIIVRYAKPAWLRHPQEANTFPSLWALVTLASRLCEAGLLNSNSTSQGA